ncbi:MAG TPA: hypothetical protein VK752_22550 [Bryobacteraceae bacterium]|jgi:hypothetical protein|nr:hypothetical protein [Bryobacteraceae bacterium]
MSRIQEIEQAIETLSPEEFSEIARWVLELEQKRWDDQMNRDAASGKLDFLREEAKVEKNGFPKNWP